MEILLGKAFIHIPGSNTVSLVAELSFSKE
jgi:hypothetical protein